MEKNHFFLNLARGPAKPIGHRPNSPSGLLLFSSLPEACSISPLSLGPAHPGLSLSAQPSHLFTPLPSPTWADKPCGLALPLSLPPQAQWQSQPISSSLLRSPARTEAALPSFSPLLTAILTPPPEPLMNRACLSAASPTSYSSPT